MLQKNDNAPLEIKVVDQDGKEASLKDYTDKTVVLYFYPKDNTPGCTIQACSLRDNNDEIQKTGAAIIGVSKDSPKSHQGFIEKQDLNFTLWSDPDHKLMDAFGVWVEKSMFGKKYMGTQRATFIINEDGIITHVWEKATPKDHGKEILEALS